MNDARQRLGAAIRAARKQAKISIHALGLEIGTDGSNVSRMERGLQEIPIEKLGKIAALLGMQVWHIWLLAEVPADRRDTLAALLRNFEKLPPEGQRQLADYSGFLLRPN